MLNCVLISLVNAPLVWTPIHFYVKDRCYHANCVIGPFYHPISHIFHMGAYIFRLPVSTLFHKNTCNTCELILLHAFYLLGHIDTHLKFCKCFLAILHSTCYSIFVVSRSYRLHELFITIN